MTATAPLPHSAGLDLTRSLTAADMARVNELIISYAESEIPLIGQMVRHLVLSGGKRLRPILTLLCARMLGYSGSRHIALASAVEFIHTATLLHDDVVDESHLRRGLATARDVWGNKASVLVGDFLLSRAFQLMVADGSLKVLKILSDASAIIAQGEVLQLTTSNELTTSEAQYLDVIIGKTATLFAAATEIGAVITDQEALEPVLREFGLSLGIAFQIMDDALDYVAEQGKLGKTVGDDFREGKITLPVIHAYGQGSAEEKVFWARTLQDVKQQEGDLEQALALLGRYGSIDYSIGVAKGYCGKALKQLQTFPASPEKAALEEIVHFCISRAY
jgi:octaprenyl-diphosphate synthase